MSSNLFHIIVVIVVTFLVGMLVSLPANQAGKEINGKRHITNGLTVYFLLLLIMPFTALLCYASFFARPSQQFLAFGIASVCFANAVFMLYHTFFIKIAYDENHLYFYSLLKGKHCFDWQQIKAIGYSSIFHGSYIISPVGKIWFFEIQAGHDELLGLLAEK